MIHLYRLQGITNLFPLLLSFHLSVNLLRTGVGPHTALMTTFLT